MKALTSSTAPWTQLQTELRDLAYVLDRRGSHTAADLASSVAARIGELLGEETSAPAGDSRPASRQSLP